jgi:hypothetical protein
MSWTLTIGGFVAPLVAPFLRLQPVIAVAENHRLLLTPMLSLEDF